MSRDAERKEILACLAKHGFIFVRTTYHGELFRHPATRVTHMVPRVGHLGDPRAIKNQRAELRRLGISI